MDPTLPLFAIEAGVRLGRKLNDVLVDETKERALILPLGNLYANVAENDAIDYFREHTELTADGGPYAALNRAEKLKAYRTLIALGQRLGDPDDISGEARELVANLQRFKQVKEGYGAKPALQRLLGEVVEVSIDYFAGRPDLLAGDSNAKKILAAFIAKLDNVAFAETTPRELVNNILLASIKTLESNITLIDDDLRLQALIGGITQAVVEDHAALTSQGDQVRREQLIQRIASSIIRGGAAALSQNIDLFWPGDSGTYKVVASTLSQVLGGISGKEDLFTNASLEMLYKSALQTAAEHADLFTDQEIIREFIQRTLRVLAGDHGGEVFSAGTIPDILQYALETMRLHAERLIDADDPQEQLLADAVRILSSSLAADIGDGRKIKDLFSKKQMVWLARSVLEETAMYPELIVGKKAAGDRHTALSHIVGATALALAQSPAQWLSGERLTKIMAAASRAASQNPGKMLDSESDDVRHHILYQVIDQLVTRLVAYEDRRGLITGEVFEQVMQRVLPLASANIEALLPDGARPIDAAVAKALWLADGVLENRINRENLPVLIEQLLVRVLWSELDLQDLAALKNEAQVILRNAL